MTAPPLLTPSQAAVLLEQVIHEQVLECVDLDALYRLEQSLTLLVGELEGGCDDRASELVQALLDRALLRLPGDVRGYLCAASWPFKDDELPDDEHEEEPARPAAAGASVRHASRLKS